MARVRLHRFDQRFEDLVPLRLAHFTRQFLDAGAHVARAGIFGAIDAVPETHHGLLVGALAPHVLGGVLRLADLGRHVHHVLRCAAVRRPRKRGHGCRDGGVEIGFGACHHPRRERRCIRAVLGVQDHVDVHQARGIGAWRDAFQHVEKVRSVPQARIRRHRFAAMADVLVGRHDHRHLRGQPDALAQRRFGRVVGDLGIEGGERGNRGAQDIHRVRRFCQPDQLENFVRKPAGGPELFGEGLELAARRQLAAQQQMARFLEGRAFSEVVDGVAAVAQFAGAPVDEAHARAVEVDALQAAADFSLVVFLSHAGAYLAGAPADDSARSSREVSRRA